MTCINTGNAWVRVRKGARRKGSWRIFTALWLLAVDLDLPKELSFGLFSFAQRFAVACLHGQPDLFPEKTFVGLVDGVNEAWVADRPTSHRCWPSRSAFQGWLCLDNTSQYRCWRLKTTVGAYWSGNVHSVCPLQSAGARSGTRGSTFLVVTSMHWGHSEVFLEGKIFKDLQHPRRLVCLPNCCWRRCVGDVAGMTWESWDGNWLELELLLTSLSWWWTLCRESLALIFFVECGPVLQVYTSALGSYQHVLVTLIMENTLKSRACRHGTDSRCHLGY